MNQLINITENNGTKVVSARELHIFVESRQEFASWIKNRIDKYGLIENEDFEVFDNFIKNPEGGRPLKEYALKIDTAKELAMVEANDKGKQARRYFIAIEKQAKTPQPVMLDKNHQHLTLLSLMKQQLRKGDMKAIALENGFTYDAVRNIFYGSSRRPEVIKAVFEKALANKKTIGVNTQAMINQLN
ncbi:antA/AntB antirepressor family protein [Flavobacterium geliluteum]|uniref:AntA/AntB antirepressor family protein n=1 Tax=Flavobacterium geliluteum TaxID=2816120 RepID=A0A941AY66_9FLAO|nr:antA/AntB antirepressor family protein [Flavobacterium geliluteum]MBP4139990.1 antA/AntB antirepressor family protein [Flavobacterium geliluteum]